MDEILPETPGLADAQNQLEQTVVELTGEVQRLRRQNAALQALETDRVSSITNITERLRSVLSDTAATPETLGDGAPAGS